MIQKIINIILLVFVLITILYVFDFINETFASNQKNIVQINVYNPFRIGVIMEFKCDHNFNTQKYNYYKIINIPGKGNYKIFVPGNVKNCEIWPLRIKLW